METVVDLVEKLGGKETVSFRMKNAGLKVGYGAIMAWEKKGIIPLKYWSTLLSWKDAGLTMDLLFRIASGKKS